MEEKSPLEEEFTEGFGSSLVVLDGDGDGDDSGDGPMGAFARGTPRDGAAARAHFTVGGHVRGRASVGDMVGGGLLAQPLPVSGRRPSPGPRLLSSAARSGSRGGGVSGCDTAGALCGSSGGGGGGEAVHPSSPGDAAWDSVLEDGGDVAVPVAGKGARGPYLRPPSGVYGNLELVDDVAYIPRVASQTRILRQSEYSSGGASGGYTSDGCSGGEEDSLGDCIEPGLHQRLREAVFGLGGVEGGKEGLRGLLPDHRSSVYDVIWS